MIKQSLGILVLMTTLGLAACGVKPVDVDPPPGASQYDFPQTYPDPATDPATDPRGRF